MVKDTVVVIQFSHHDNLHHAWVNKERNKYLVSIKLIERTTSSITSKYTE